VIPAGAVQENVPGVVYCSCPTVSEPVTPPRVTPGVICTLVRVIAILLFPCMIFIKKIMPTKKHYE
jgi:hypothetical protein